MVFALSLSLATDLQNDLFSDLQNDLSRSVLVLEFSIDRLRIFSKNADLTQVLKCNCLKCQVLKCEMTFSITSKLFMSVINDAITNSSSYSLKGIANPTGFRDI